MSEKILGFDFEGEIKNQPQQHKSAKKNTKLTDDENKELENQMVVAIASRDAKQIEDIFAKGFKMSGTLNGKRVSQLAMESFDEEVMDVLTKGGMKMAYINSLGKIAVGHNGDGAVRYLHENHADLLNDASWHIMMTNAIKNKNIDSCEYIVKNYNLALKSWNIYEKITLFSNAIDQERDFLVDAILKENLTSKNIDIIQVFQQMNVTYKHCKYLQHLINSNKRFAKEMKSKFPCFNYYNYQYISSDLGQLIGGGNFIVDGKENEHTQKTIDMIRKHEHEKINDFMEYLILNAQRAVMSILDTKNGVKIINEKIKRPYIFISFLNKSSAEMKKKALEKLPALKTFKDTNNNNIAHYMLCETPTQTMADILLRVVPELMNEENKYGHTPINSLEPAKRAKVSKKIIKKEIKMDRKERGLKQRVGKKVKRVM